MSKMPKNSKSGFFFLKIFLIVLLYAITIAGMLYYFNYRMERQRADYESAILELSRETVAGLVNVKGELSNQIELLNLNMSSRISYLDTNIQNFKKQNQQEIKTLSGLIDQIEQQSNIKLNELKDELKNVKIRSQDFSGIVDDVLNSVVSVGTNIGQGSGAIIDAKGYIVTNLHVINGAAVIRVTTYSSKTYDVEEVAGYDENADIAVLKISAPGIKALKFGDSDSLKVGEKVIAAGNPAGLSFTVTEGIVSAFRTAPNNIKYIQTDVPINPGNSGGPLINVRGEIVGINNFKVRDFESLGFGISSNDVKIVVDRIIGTYEASLQEKKLQ